MNEKRREKVSKSEKHWAYEKTKKKYSFCVVCWGSWRIQLLLAVVQFTHSHLRQQFLNRKIKKKWIFFADKQKSQLPLFLIVRRSSLSLVLFFSFFFTEFYSFWCQREQSCKLHFHCRWNSFYAVFLYLLFIVLLRQFWINNFF